MLLSFRTGIFSPVDRNEMQETFIQNETVEHKLESFAAVVVLRTLLTLLISAISHTPKVKIHTTQKLCHFGCYVAKAKLLCLKCFVPVARAGVFI